MTTLAVKTIERAKLSIGAREDGNSNWSKRVKAFLSSVGIHTPAPWCAAFVNSMIKNAARSLGITSAWPSTGYVQALYDWAKPKGLVSGDPAANRVFISWHPSLNRFAHTGFIADVRKTGNGWEFLTIEGNSNTTGSREGTSVVSIWRRWDPERHRSIQII